MSTVPLRQAAQGTRQISTSALRSSAFSNLRDICARQLTGESHPAVQKEAKQSPTSAPEWSVDRQSMIQSSAPRFVDKSKTKKPIPNSKTWGAHAPKKFVPSPNGKHYSNNVQIGSKPASSELSEEIDFVQEQLQALNSKLQHVVRMLNELPQRRAEPPVDDSWGPDRLAPPDADSTWSASSAQKPAPPSDAGPRKFDTYGAPEPTELLSGNSLLANSKLSFRDGIGKMKSTVSYGAVASDPAKRFHESISGSLSTKDVPIDKVAPLRKMEVATLAHGLDRVLFNPGVHWLREPRSGIYNFDPRLKDILDVDLFDYAALPPYITSSQDPDLAKLTKQHGKKFYGSTSSMTSFLSQCYFLLSNWRNPDLSGFSAPFANFPSGFSAGAKLPASIVLRYKDGRYAIDADKLASGEVENNNYVLTSLGKSMEKMLTSTPEEYAKYTRMNSWKLSEAEKNKQEAYHYASTDKMMMRSQLDCHDDRLPRRTFDLKTRASIGIRHDRANYVEGSGYQIRRATGALESFEREYFDMVRAAFLKYNFQARIGHMDGIMVAYHTTSTIFGFQYVPIEEMNERLFGSQEMADQAFKLSLGMMEHLLEAASSMFPEQSVKITMDGKDKGDVPTSLFVQPVEPEADATAPAETAAPAAEAPPKRKIVQLDVTVDRFLDGKLVAGPVEFSALPGRRIDTMTDDEIERRLRLKLPEVRWEVDFQISPRPDLTEQQVRDNLSTVRQKQFSMSSLILPNVEALNEREQYRMQTLAEHPEALKRFLEERASGAAAGMPLAPGQISAETSSPTPTLDTPEAPAAEPAMSKSRARAEARFVRMRHLRTIRLRELAKLGAQDAKLSLASDQHILYQSQS